MRGASDDLFPGAAVPLSSRAEDEEAWLADRRTMVTASESAHLMGSYKGAPFAKTPMELAESKRRTKPEKVGPRAHAGRWWEEPISRWFARLSGLEILGLDRLYRSLEHPFMGATPDGLVVGTSEPDEELVPWLHVAEEFDLLRGLAGSELLKTLFLPPSSDDAGATSAPRRTLVEIKHQESKRRSRWNKPGKLDAGYRNQALHQAVVCDADLVLVVAKVDANEVYVHPVFRDPEYEELLVARCERFANRYLRG